MAYGERACRPRIDAQRIAYRQVVCRSVHDVTANAVGESGAGAFADERVVAGDEGRRVRTRNV